MIEIRSETELNIAVRALEEYAAAIEAYHNSRKEFEVGESYAWRPDSVGYNQGKRHGPLKCVYIGHYQGLFTGDTVGSAGAFENNNGLHIIATAHLKTGRFVKVS